MGQRIDTIAYRRKRQGHTDYRRRLKMLSGNGIRLVVRKSLQHTYAQLIEYGAEGDRILATANTEELRKYGWKMNGGNLMSGYLVGILIAQKAKACKVQKAIFDIGAIASTKGSRLYSVLKGAVAGGLQIPHDASILPSDDRIMGKHVQMQSSGFSKYRAAGIAPEGLAAVIMATKERIVKG